MCIRDRLMLWTAPRPARECPHRSVADLTVSLPVAKIGAFRTVLGCHLTQGSLKSLSLPTTFQADDDGSIPFTRSNACRHLPADYLPYGAALRVGPDCSGGCKFFYVLADRGDEAISMDWGVCANPLSHRLGLLTFGRRQKSGTVRRCCRYCRRCRGRTRTNARP